MSSLDDLRTGVREAAIFNSSASGEVIRLRHDDRFGGAGQMGTMLEGGKFRHVAEQEYMLSRAIGELLGASTFEKAVTAVAAAQENDQIAAMLPALAEQADRKLGEALQVVHHLYDQMGQLEANHGVIGESLDACEQHFQTEA